MRLLTEEEIRQAVEKSGAIITGDGIMWDAEKSVAKAQRDLTHKETLKAVIPFVEKFLTLAEHGDYANGIEAFGVDEGRVQAGELLDAYREEWEAFKRGEMPEEGK